ncbi:MAG: nitrous oxide-stimulated promoter family protein [Muribaculaceae bacterium]|nr:nitrous oxide-stimulated promoter family protein [Muribaculaceae bacterium]
MTRIEREKQTVRKMIELYCSHRLKADTISEACQHLDDFACRFATISIKAHAR